MAQVTIDLADDTLRALERAAARRGSTVGQIIKETVELYVLRDPGRAADLLAKARRSAALSETVALRLAVAETRQRRNP